MIGLALALAAAAAADRPTGDERREMLHCFARRSVEAPWAARSAAELAADADFARHLSKRCDPEIVPLYAAAYEMADEQLRGADRREALLNRRSVAVQNVVAAIQQMLPAALSLRHNLPPMAPDEQRNEFFRWLFDDEEAVDDPATPVGRLYALSVCAAREEQGRAAQACDAERVIRGLETEFAAVFPGADPALTADLARDVLARGTMWATIGGIGPAIDEDEEREADADH